MDNEELKIRVIVLEEDYINLMVAVNKKLYNLEKTINRLSLACSLSFLLAFLFIGYVAKWI